MSATAAVASASPAASSTAQDAIPSATSWIFMPVVAGVASSAARARSTTARTFASSSGPGIATRAAPPAVTMSMICIPPGSDVRLRASLVTTKPGSAARKRAAKTSVAARFALMLACGWISARISARSPCTRAVAAMPPARTGCATLASTTIAGGVRTAT